MKIKWREKEERGFPPLPLSDHLRAARSPKESLKAAFYGGKTKGGTRPYLWRFSPFWGKQKLFCGAGKVSGRRHFLRHAGWDISKCVEGSPPGEGKLEKKAILGELFFILSSQMAIPCNASSLFFFSLVSGCFIPSGASLGTRQPFEYRMHGVKKPAAGRLLLISPGACCYSNVPIVSSHLA